jgi:hypothetical protein
MYKMCLKAQNPRPLEYLNFPIASQKAPFPTTKKATLEGWPWQAGCKSELVHLIIVFDFDLRSAYIA